MNSKWQWPGSKWWKCDLHLHTPGSYDFNNKGAVTEHDWILAAKAQNLQVVGVTDHNTGSWIDRVKEVADLHDIVVLPGVELTVSGIHLLVLFSPQATGDTITGLLGKCNIEDEMRGKSEANSTSSFRDAMGMAVKKGAICIAAHVTESKGFLKGTAPGQTLMDIVKSENLHAIEINARDADLELYVDNSMPDYKRLKGTLSNLCFSDGHCITQIGRRYTWLKMSNRNLEGLKLALTDGPNSCVRCDFDLDDPNHYSDLCIESVEISQAKYIGRNQPLEVGFNPWLNTIIGGRGSGKSSIVEFLRIGLDREDELPERMKIDFSEFKKIPKDRESRGLLKDETSITVTIRKNGTRYRAKWNQMGDKRIIEHQNEDGTWSSAAGIVRDRFPIRIYSQKQIFELANQPQFLLKIVDESPQVNYTEWQAQWHSSTKRFLSLGAQAREIMGILAEKPRLDGELEDIKYKIQVFESNDHESTLRTYNSYLLQQQMVESWLKNLKNVDLTITKAARETEIRPLEGEESLCNDNEAMELTSLSKSVSAKSSDVKDELLALSKKMSLIIDDAHAQIEKSIWKQSLDSATHNYKTLTEQLTKAGTSSLSEYDSLVKRRQEIMLALSDIADTEYGLRELEEERYEVLRRVCELRTQLTESRSGFITSVLENNLHIRVKVVPHGDIASAEKEFRQVILKDDKTFQNDIGGLDSSSGLLNSLYLGYPNECNFNDFEIRLGQMKRQIRGIHANETAFFKGRSQRFISYIQSLPEEAIDKLEFWFPSDTLDISYSTGTEHKNFRPIDHGSPGQKTAAILAFLLTYGEEPIVLDQPEDDLDNLLIYSLIVQQLRNSKKRRQIITVTHNANIVVNGDAELVISLDMKSGQTQVTKSGGLQEQGVRDEICRVMEGGREAFELRYQRISKLDG